MRCVSLIVKSRSNGRLLIQMVARLTKITPMFRAKQQQLTNGPAPDGPELQLQPQHQNRPIFTTLKTPNILQVAN